MLKNTDPLDIETVKQKMVHRLIRMRALERFRLLDKYYLVAIDGSGLFSTNERHCKYCLVKKSKETGEVLKYHHILLIQNWSPPPVSLPRWLRSFWKILIPKLLNKSVNKMP